MARVLLATTGQRGGGYTSTTRVLRDTDKPSEAARLIQDRLPEYRDWVRWWTSLRDQIKLGANPDEDKPIVPDSFAIADAVRMSMSIPYFFQPIELVHNETGKSSTIVDGGVLSNFPVWIFDVEDRDALRPTFGFRLVGGKGVGGGLEGVIHTLGWAAEMGADIFHTATDAWDKHFLSKATIVRTCMVEIGDDIGTTDFDLSATQKQSLLDSGHAAAQSFLDTYRPEDYVNRHGQRLAAAVAVT